MAQLQTEDGLAFVAVGSQLVYDVVELVVDAMIEGKVTRNKVFVPDDFYLEFLNHLLVEVRNLEHGLVRFGGKTRSIQELVISGADVPEDLDGLALERNLDLCHEIILIVDLDVVEQSLNVLLDELV